MVLYWKLTKDIRSMKINLKLLTIFSSRSMFFFQLYQSVLYALIGTEKYSDCSQISFKSY